MAVQSHITLMMKMNACMIFIAYINHRFLFCHRKTCSTAVGMIHVTGDVSCGKNFCYHCVDIIYSIIVCQGRLCASTNAIKRTPVTVWIQLSHCLLERYITHFSIGVWSRRCRIEFKIL